MASEKQKVRMIMLAAVVSAAMSALTNASTGNAFDVPCVDPWIEECRTSQSQCWDCKIYCEGNAFPAGECEVESSECVPWQEGDPGRECSAGQYYNECTCKKKSKID